MMTAARQVSYQWRLREVMAAHGLFNATDLEPLLAERGIRLSSVQVWRLVTQTPERLSLPVLAALCDIFDDRRAQLIATTAEQHPCPQTAAAGGDGRDGPERDPAPPRPAPTHPSHDRRPGQAALRPVRPPRPSRHPLPRRATCAAPACAAALEIRGICPGCSTEPGITRPPPRRPDAHLPGLRRHHPPLHLPALRLRRQPGRRAALPPLRPHQCDHRNLRPCHPAHPGHALCRGGPRRCPQRRGDRPLAGHPPRPRPARRPHHRPPAAHPPGPRCPARAIGDLPARPARQLRRPPGHRPAARRRTKAWLHHRLASLAGHPHEKLLRQFSLWHQLPRMRAKAATGPLRPSARRYAEQRFIQAQNFLSWTTTIGRHPAASHPGRYRRLARHRRHSPKTRCPQFPHLGHDRPPHPRPAAPAKSASAKARPSPSTAASACSAATSPTTRPLCGSASSPASCCSTPSHSAASSA